MKVFAKVSSIVIVGVLILKPMQLKLQRILILELVLYESGMSYYKKFLLYER